MERSADDTLRLIRMVKLQYRVMKGEVTRDLKESVYTELKDNGPSSASLTQLSEELSEDRERTRLALRELFREGHVMETADWDYRVTYPTQDF